MKRVTIIRRVRKDIPENNGIFGNVYLHNDDGDLLMQCVSGELPWRNNTNGISCIEMGTYICSMAMYDNKPHYLLDSVENRQRIYITNCNLFGDSKQGLKSNSNGCIGLGKTIEFNSTHKQFELSKTDDTLKLFHSTINDGKIGDRDIWKPFILTIT